MAQDILGKAQGDLQADPEEARMARALDMRYLATTTTTTTTATCSIDSCIGKQKSRAANEVSQGRRRPAGYVLLNVVCPC